MIYEIGGRSSIDTAESSDVHGFHLEVVTKYMFRSIKWGLGAEIIRNDRLAIGK